MEELEIPEAEINSPYLDMFFFVTSAEASKSVTETIAKKAADHNDKYGGDSCKKTSSRTLMTVFRRGVGAYKTNPQSVRPNVSGPEQWGYGRVNGFLHALRTGSFKRKPFDVDLLPSCHPQKKKNKTSGSKKPLKGVGEIFNSLFLDSADPDWKAKYQKALKECKEQCRHHIDPTQPTPTEEYQQCVSDCMKFKGFNNG